MKKLFVLLSVICLTVFVGCYSPSPLYGGWSDNAGNRITFMEDGSFNAAIVVGNSTRQYSGNYSVMENVLIMSAGDTIVTEWDLRGSILYIEWTVGIEGTDSDTMHLSLYHTS